MEIPGAFSSSARRIGANGAIAGTFSTVYVSVATGSPGLQNHGFLFKNGQLGVIETPSPWPSRLLLYEDPDFRYEVSLAVDLPNLALDRGANGVVLTGLNDHGQLLLVDSALYVDEFGSVYVFERSFIGTPLE
jgi:hypothetical protein